MFLLFNLACKAATHQSMYHLLPIHSGLFTSITLKFRSFFQHIYLHLAMPCSILYVKSVLALQMCTLHETMFFKSFPDLELEFILSPPFMTFNIATQIASTKHIGTTWKFVSNAESGPQNRLIVSEFTF